MSLVARHDDGLVLRVSGVTERYSVALVMPFTSERKRMSTLVQKSTVEPATSRLYTKGTAVCAALPGCCVPLF